MVARFYVA